MATRPNGAEQRQLRTLFHPGAIGELTDGQLLERFAARGGEAAELAFAALVERHGPMVWGLPGCAARPSRCSGRLPGHFLVLVQKARSLWVQIRLVPGSIGLPTAWPAEHGRLRPAGASTSSGRGHDPALVSPEQGDREEMMAVLHEEIDRLPERCRVLVVLCDLQGLSTRRRRAPWLAGRNSQEPAGPSERTAAGPIVTPRTGPVRRHASQERPRSGSPSSIGRSCIAGSSGRFHDSCCSFVRGGQSVRGRNDLGRVAILIEEVLKTIFFPGRVASTILIISGIAAGTAGVLAVRGRTGANEPGPPCSW